MGYAITTRYAGPTNYRGSRILATGPSLTHDGTPVRRQIPWNYALDSRDNHRAGAAVVLEILQRAGWRVTLGPAGYLPDERTCAHVLAYAVDTDR